MAKYESPPYCQMIGGGVYVLYFPTANVFGGTWTVAFEKPAVGPGVRAADPRMRPPRPSVSVTVPDGTCVPALSISCIWMRNV